MFISSALSGGTGNVILDGGGTLVVSGASTYSGTTTINGSVLSISASNNLGNGAATNTLVIAGGTLQSTGAAVDLTANRAINIGVGGATLDVTGTNSLRIPGVISAASAAPLSKTGTGKLVLAGANTFSGPTNVNAGELVVQGSLQGSVNVAATATPAKLSSGPTGLIGALAASSSNASGATVSPGSDGGSGLSTVGVLTANGNVALGNAGTTISAHLTLEIGGTTAGSAYDQLNVTGANRTVSLDNVDLSITAVNGYQFADPTKVGGFYLTDGAPFFILTLADSSSTLSGTFKGTLAPDSRLPGFSSIMMNGQLFAINYHADSASGQFNSVGNDVAVMAIPEPGVMGMLVTGLGLCRLGRFRRRGRVIC